MLILNPISLYFRTFPLDIMHDDEVLVSGEPSSYFLEGDISNPLFSVQDGEILLFSREEIDELAEKIRNKKAQEQLLAEWKANRAEEVSNIVVDVDGKKFNGDELSQARMGRTWILMDDLATTEWSLADTPAGVMTVVTKEELKKACELAGKEQTRLWKV